MPAREQDIRWAARLAEKVYHGLDVIPEATMMAWFHANPHGFSTFWYGDKPFGNFDILPLRPDAIRRFVEGTLLEREIDPGDLFSDTESGEIRDLHWESIILDPDFAGSRSRMMKMFVQAYPEILGRLCPLNQIEKVYAIAASKQGAGVLRRMGLSVVSEAEERLDGHPLYCGTMDGYRAAMERHFRSLRG